MSKDRTETLESGVASNIATIAGTIARLKYQWGDTTGSWVGDKAGSPLSPPPLEKLWKTRVSRSQTLNLPSSKLSNTPPSHAAIALIAQAPGV